MTRWQHYVAALLTIATGASAQSRLFIGSDTVPTAVESIYARGLRYLVNTQQADGSWDDQYGREPGVVGLAVLAMLACGEDPNVGPHQVAIHRGLRYILSCADAKTGQIGLPATLTMYSHGFATLALAEAYGEVDEPGLGPALQRGVDLIVAAQKRNTRGAWRYKADSTDADTTVSGAQMVALFAARNAGIAVPDDSIVSGLKFFRSCQDPAGGIGYDGAGRSVTLTSIGMLVFTLARQKDTAAYRTAASVFKQASEGERNILNPYHAYYASQAAFHCDEATWQAWNQVNIAGMQQHQGSDGSLFGGNYGSCFNTAAGLLSLALNYRYLPIYER